MRSPVLFIFSIVFALVQLAGIELKKPNVLLIAVDDLNDWVGCLGGHPQTVTPISIDSQRGILFSNAHRQGTMCNPSRISLLWGRRPSSTGFYDNRYPILKEQSLNSMLIFPILSWNGYHFESARFSILVVIFRSRALVKGSMKNST